MGFNFWKWLGAMLGWWAFDSIVLCLFPLYAIGWPIDWLMAKIKKQEPINWWGKLWKLNDWFEQKVLEA